MKSNFKDLVTNLILLERDAIAAYDTCIDKLDDPASAEKIREFRSDHHQHLDVLQTMAREVEHEFEQIGRRTMMLRMTRHFAVHNGGRKAN
ncbi:DUF2383 domain-containing protein [Tranquillimonas alkanivorans]|uniref:DUF2383 domain-containing protein n=1 Tax=Tranquillimonas alkanivorans TaxID=441119 RepID=A0A1I5WRP3_9RHOB|nr:DUF2383 domain-containing protein [Tranquillimonas alkanivorans]SFQ22188.1 protein of unknown function [Tranquillimonas alkanivorans]